jgi:vacuolar protein sorting-associated protein 13A/C
MSCGLYGKLINEDPFYPDVCFLLQIGLLHGVMSDKEYNVAISCISTNLSDTPNLPPSFRENMNRTKESIRLLADKVNLSNHLLLSRTVAVMTVEIQYALLELRNGPDAESPLAELAVSIPNQCTCSYRKYVIL